MKRYLLLLVLIVIGMISVAVAQDTGSTAQRIISLSPINTENVYLLNAQDRLIANTIYCVNPPEAKEKKKIGTLLQANIEKIVSLKPDLVLATSLTRPRQVAKLKRLGIKVVQFTQPANFDEIGAQFIEMGQLIGREKRARRIVNEARKAIDHIRQKTAGRLKKKVFLQVGTRPLFSSLEDSFTNEFITLGGGQNIAKGSLQGVYSREKVIAQNPDLIIIAIMGTEGVAGEKEQQKWMRYPSISAVKKKEIHIVDPNLVCSPSPRTFVEALRTIASLIHPEVILKGKGDE